MIKNVRSQIFEFVVFKMLTLIKTTRDVPNICALMDTLYICHMQQHTTYTYGIGTNRQKLNLREYQHFFGKLYAFGH